MLRYRIEGHGGTPKLNAVRVEECRPYRRRTSSTLALNMQILVPSSTVVDLSVRSEGVGQSTLSHDFHHRVSNAVGGTKVHKIFSLLVPVTWRFDGEYVRCVFRLTRVLFDPRFR